MRRSDEPSQKRPGGQRKSNQLPPTSYSEEPEHNTRYTDDDLQDNDDPTSGPLRPSSSAIRRTNLPIQRNTNIPSSAIPPRRTGQPQKTQQPSVQQPRPPTAPITTAINIDTNRQKLRPPTREQPNKSGLQGKVHWLLPIGIGMIAMLVLWELGSLTLAWGLARLDDLKYGNPRTYQTNAVVGHGSDSVDHPSHFIAVNLNRQAIIVEFPAGNPAGAESYIVPYQILGPGGDLTPITVEFRDVTNDGKPDMIVHIHIQPQDQTFVFVNDGKKFRPPTNKDNIHL